MVPISTWKVLIVCSAVALFCAMLGCSLGNDGLTERMLTERLEEQAEQTRLDN